MGQIPLHLPSSVHNMRTALQSRVRGNRKTSDMFSVTLRQGCVLAPTLFNFYFDTTIHMPLDVHRQERGIKVVYLLDADLVGNRRNLKLET